MDDGLWYDYDIELSLDGKAWTKILSNRASGQTLLPDRFPETETARYLRINIHAVSGDNPVGIYLVEIHGDKSKKEFP
jgi:hypothetical protein